VSFTIYDLASGVALARPDWTVTNLLHDPDDVDVLFGLDLLREIVLIVNGQGQTFSLDFSACRRHSFLPQGRHGMT
jgi:hypothetical protein